MGRLFGTDGVRGVAISELTTELAMQIGRAAALVLAEGCQSKPKIFIGKDTRISGDVLEAALVAGICSVGADAYILGVVPTPATAYLVRKHGADAGVVISASHNSVEFNGIKLFSSTGFKLDDETEEKIEALILDAPERLAVKDGCEVGRIVHFEQAADEYTEYIKLAAKADLSGIRAVIDCANGAASRCAKRIFTELGADCIFISAEPDGTNINDSCGSTHMENLIAKVSELNADVGLAFDGDADRCLAVDENGEMIDGDKLLAIFSKYFKQNGSLGKDTCVVTVMTNIGFYKFAEAEKIAAEKTAVGDRYVLERMLEGGFNLGGEQSGHVIMLDYSTTGDGELTGLKLLEIMAQSKKKASELAGEMESFPQVLVNVKITADKKGLWSKNQAVTEKIKEIEQLLGSDGRILVRESGTEPLVRIMLEGRDISQITELAEQTAEKVREM
ncbi:MAG: phosphoglucosamine mutase [Ruminococcus sp.]|nr:phosphoglucosamine mutase [Ruminococcus sp.]